MKEIMKENKANNLRLGAIYINTNTSQPARLITILPCEGVWMETYDGQGYGNLVEFDDVAYADMDEVKDFLDDHAVWMGSNKAPSHKPALEHPRVLDVKQREYAYGKELIKDSDGSMVIGWYDDNEGNDYRCRD